VQAVTCGEAVLRLLAAYGVDTVFGMAGTMTLELYRGIARAGIRHVQCRNEQALYVKLARTGGVVISGDLYHYAEERTLHRMPKEEGSTGTPAAREAMERFLKEKRAQLWIGHSTSFFKNAVKSPGWYD
jgi:hypothetical protein